MGEGGGGEGQSCQPNMPECIKNLELWLKFSRGPWEVVVLKEFNGGFGELLCGL